MKAKELATDELLKMATPRPWKCNVTDAKSGTYIFSQADAHLFVRAVNSFEAMRDVLKMVAREGWTNGLGQKAACLCCGTIGKHAYKCSVAEALALAEGKAVQS